MEQSLPVAEAREEAARQEAARQEAAARGRSALPGDLPAKPPI